MIIPAIKIRPEYSLKLDEAQMVLDWESLMVRLGLKYCLQCVKCSPRTDLSGDIVEAGISKEGSTYTLELACACSRFVFQGDGLVPQKPIVPDIQPRLDQEHQDRTMLSRVDMFTFEAFDQLRSHVLRMRYWMRCMRCENEDQADGVYGANQSTGSRFVVECHCTKRIYEGHDAPAPVH